MDELLALMSEGTTDTIQIYRTIAGQDPAAINNKNRVTSSLDSTGLILLGLGVIIVLGMLATRRS